MAALERDQEALEAGNSVECLTEELCRLRMDLARQEALASRRGDVTPQNVPWQFRHILGIL